MPVHPVQFDGHGELVRVNVRKTEEKGSDVNLAANMLVDAFRGIADTYFLLSNDSDFAEAFRMVRDDVGADIGLISPTDQPSQSLLRVTPTYLRQVRRGVLAASQFPDTIRDANGIVHRPSRWR